MSHYRDNNALQAIYIWFHYQAINSKIYTLLAYNSTLLICRLQTSLYSWNAWRTSSVLFILQFIKTQFGSLSWPMINYAVLEEPAANYERGISWQEACFYQHSSMVITSSSRNFPQSLILGAQNLNITAFGLDMSMTISLQAMTVKRKKAKIWATSWLKKHEFLGFILRQKFKAETNSHSIACNILNIKFNLPCILPPKWYTKHRHWPWNTTRRRPQSQSWVCFPGKRTVYAWYDTTWQVSQANHHTDV